MSVTRVLCCSVTEVMYKGGCDINDVGERDKGDW